MGEMRRQLDAYASAQEEREEAVVFAVAEAEAAAAADVKLTSQAFLISQLELKISRERSTHRAAEVQAVVTGMVEDLVGLVEGEAAGAAPDKAKPSKIPTLRRAVDGAAEEAAEAEEGSFEELERACEMEAAGGDTVAAEEQHHQQVWVRCSGGGVWGAL